MAAEPNYYSYTLADAVRFAVLSARQKLAPSRCLIAGPYVGEFGWELMQWQGYVRARRHYYEQVHVITYPGRDYLYEGCIVHHHSIPLHEAGFRYGKLSPRLHNKLARDKAAQLGLHDPDVFSPDLLCTQYHKRLFWRQEFRLFQEPPLNGIIRDVAFHFRLVDKPGDDPKNYPADRANELADQCRRRGFSVICIGHPDYAFCADGCEDQRSVDLRHTVAAISGVRLVAGQNSGPMHLANLCGKPTVLWAFAQSSIDYSLRWNPFRVPIYVAANDTYQPAPDRVCQTVLQAFENLKMRTEEFTKPPFSLPARKIAYY